MRPLVFDLNPRLRGYAYLVCNLYALFLKRVITMKKLIIGIVCIFLGVFGLMITLVGSMLLLQPPISIFVKGCILLLIILFPTITIFGAVKLSQGLHLID